MVDTCVCCGDIIPEGSQVCLKCASSGGLGVACPSCDALLEAMDSYWWNTAKGICKTTVFHCRTCHTDWEKEAEYEAKPVKFVRKFWG